MKERSNVIDALERCARLQESPMSGECAHCPYLDKSLGTCLSITPMLMDAAKLLKPRLMTLDEVKAHYSLPPIFPDDLMEQEDYLNDIKPLYFEFIVDDSWAVHWRTYYDVRDRIDEWIKNYGKSWRCWTDKPSDEQRKEVAWDE